MTVWIAEEGEPYEGRSIRGVFATEDAAVRHIETLNGRNDDRTWESTALNRWADQYGTYRIITEHEVK